MCIYIVYLREGRRGWRAGDIGVLAHRLDLRAQSTVSARDLDRAAAWKEPEAAGDGGEQALAGAFRAQPEERHLPIAVEQFRGQHWRVPACRDRRDCVRSE